MAWKFVENRIAQMFEPGNYSITAAALAAAYPGVLPPPLLTSARAVDPLYGEATFVLAYGVASLQVGDFVSINPLTGAVTRTVVATRSGIMGVSMAANTDTTALSWYQVSGTAVVRCTTAASAGLPLYQSATAGTLLSTVAATGLVLGCTSASATGFTNATKACYQTNGSNILVVPNFDGLFVGMTMAGVNGSPTITAMGLGGTYGGQAQPAPGTLTMSGNANATGAVTVTPTGTGFALAAISYPSSVGLG